MTDLVLEGPGPGELEALLRLAEDPRFEPSHQIAVQLQLKGWVDTVGASHLITVTGRTLLDAISGTRKRAG